jgi:hypothetical protein
MSRRANGRVTTLLPDPGRAFTKSDLTEICIFSAIFLEKIVPNVQLDGRKDINVKK